MTTRLRIESLSVRGFRNIAEAVVEPGPRVNVISGDNGQGKTSLLEALYFVATSRSFRTEKLQELRGEHAESAVIRARISEDGITREQRAILMPRSRQVLLDGKKPTTLGVYATKTPVVVFHPGDMALLTGSASERRTLLDRVALYSDPMSAHHRARYTRAVKSRQAVLEERGPSATELFAIERVVAESGAALGASRKAASERILSALAPIFSQMAAPGLVLEVEFRPGGSLDAGELEAELGKRRPADISRGNATYGPHRDDLEVRLDGRSVRRHASQGQQRIVTLALKIAELACVREARGTEPVLLLDDVSSELDPHRTMSVYRFLEATPSQVFVTTTRPDLFTIPGMSPGDRRDFHVAAGAVTELAEPPT